MYLYGKLVLIFALANGGFAFSIGENDVSCSPDGSVNVRKSALGDLASRTYAFGNPGPPFGHCKRVVREDVISFERQGYEESPLRMIIDDLSSDSFHVLDIHCTIRGLQLSDGEHDRKRRATAADGVTGSPKRDEQGNRIVGPEVNNTGLDSHGNLVRAKEFKVSVGMVVDVPYSDNDEIDIRCYPERLMVSNPDPQNYHFFMAYDSGGNMCKLQVRSDRSWIVITDCNMKRLVKVAFNDRKFSDGVIGGSADQKIYKISCAGDLYDLDVERKGADRKGTEYEDYYYIYDYNSGPSQIGAGKQLLLLILTLAAVLFLERLTN